MEVKLIMRYEDTEVLNHSHVVEIKYELEQIVITEELIRTDNEDPEWEGRMGPMRYPYKYSDVYMIIAKIDGREVVTSISHKTGD